MLERRYSRYGEKEMILRDCLAADRTILANERTYLAYLRTAVSLLAGGIGLIKCMFIKGLGWGFIGMSLVMLIFGTIKFLSRGRPLKRLFS